MTDWAGIVDNVVITLGISLMVGSVLLPVAYKNLIALLVNGLMHPLTASMPFYMVILVGATALAALTALVRKYRIDGDLARRFSEKNAAFQKELREARLSGNKTKLKKLQDDQLILLDDQSRVTKQNLKATGYTMIASILLFIWMSWYMGSQPAPLTIALPFLGAHAYTDPLFIIPIWSAWLGICSIAAGYIIRKAINSTA
jgi:uncharacterized membrane protein (DUF106 family)